MKISQKCQELIPIMSETPITSNNIKISDKKPHKTTTAKQKCAKATSSIPQCDSLNVN